MSHDAIMMLSGAVCGAFVMLCLQVGTEWFSSRKAYALGRAHTEQEAALKASLVADLRSIVARHRAQDTPAEPASVGEEPAS